MRKNCIFQTCSFLLKKNEKEFCLKSSLIIKKVFLIFILLCGYQNIYSQSNDCDDNLSGQLIVGSSCSATVFNSTNDTDYWNSASGCNASDVDDAWGWFIATSTSTIITYTPTALEDPVLTLFSGSCSTAMTALSCADSYGGAQAETITYATTIGTKYRIRIQRYASNSSMYGTICIYSPIPPVNDACSSATNLPCATTNLSGTTLNSVSETHNTGCSMSNYGVWYTFTGDGTINTITTTPSTGYNIEMSISSGSCGSLTSINCQDANGGGIAETYTFTTVSGTQYYIYIAENTSGDLGTGNFTISRTCNITPTYCTPSVGSGFESLVYFNNISFVGTLNDVSNSSTYTTTPTRGYQNFTSLSNIAKQAQGEGINISMQMSSRGYVKAWVDWNSDGDFVDTNETVYNTAGIATYSTTFGFIIPANQALGNYRIRIRVNKDDNTYPYDTNAISTFDSCQNINYYGETEDYIFTVVASCSAIITSVTDGVNCGAGPVTLNAVASGSPTQYKWYANETGGTAIATTTTGTWTTPSLSTTTTYWVSAYNGCESLERKKVIANINPIATISFTPSVPEICGENQVLSLTASGDVQQNYLINENFELGLGTLTNQNIISNTSAINTITQWQTKSSTFVPAQQVWFPAIASGMSGNKFAMSTSDVGSYTTHNALISQNVNTNTFLNLTLSFNIFYSRYYVDNANPTLDYVTVDVSTDGGTTWIEIDRYLSDIGYGTRFTKKTYNLNSYINNSNFKVRVQYYGAWCDGLAIDDFQLYGNTPLNTAFNWSEAPSNNKSIIFDGGNFTSTEDIEACSCTINSGDVIITTGHTLKLHNELNVNGGSITFQDKASLVQINNNAINTGNIYYSRNAIDYTSALYDYVYWSTPTTNSSTAAVGCYSWNTTYVNTNGTQGNWSSANNTSMTTGKGYIMRDVFSKTFTGIPHNGIITTNVQRGTITTGPNKDTDNWNLIGNPYPSAIDSHLFMLSNTNIEGSIAVWTHNTSPSSANGNPFYANFVSNYQSNDYIIYNLTGSQAGPHVFEGDIAAGQGFMVKLLETGSNSQTVEFNNSMRGDNNNQFFRQQLKTIENQNTIINPESHRIWLEITNSNLQATRTLIGYIEGATNNQDRLFDATTSSSNDQKIYSLINQDKFAIQGRELPFNDQDIIPIGYDSPVSGTYIIAINAVDGLFNNQNIYLEDILTNTIHNLTLSPYIFNTSSGSYTDRFRIRFNNSTLENEDFITNNENLLVYVNENINIKSTDKTIKSIQIFDLLGRNVATYDTINNTFFTIENLKATKATLLIRVTLENGQTKPYKIIF